MENTQYPYQVEEHHQVNGGRYWTVCCQGKLIAWLRSRQVAEEYIKLNKKHDGSSTGKRN